MDVIRPGMWILTALVIVVSVNGCGGDEPPPELLCHAGAYRLDDGELLALTPSDGDTLRYRLFSGPSGRLYPDGPGRFVSGDGWSVREPVTLVVTLADCGDGRITLDRLQGEPVAGHRLPLREREVVFEGRGVKLHGKLVLPEGEPQAIAVLGHGSEDLGATVYFAWQYLLPPAGIGVFVFDKRGTGASEGEYTQDFDLLADDLAAAAREARSLVDPALPLGFLAGSQGGWVAPLAASREPVDFVLVGYGMVESPLAEDRAEVASNLRRAGYGPEVLAKAREVTDATGAVIASGFEEGYDALGAIKEKYRGEPWWEQLEGEFTQDLVRYPAWVLRIVGPWFDRGTPWEYDPLPALDAVLTSGTPILWIAGGEDTEAPMEASLEILHRRQDGPGHLDVAVFPRAEHGIIEVEGQGETRRLRGHSEGYWALQAHWIAARNLEGSFGGAELHPDPDPDPDPDPVPPAAASPGN